MAVELVAGDRVKTAMDEALYAILGCWVTKLLVGDLKTVLFLDGRVASLP